MAELTEDDLISKLATIDAQIATILGTLGTSGSGAAQYVDYAIGNKNVSGSQRLEQLLAAREAYQKLLDRLPKIITRDHGYDIQPGTGEDRTEYNGDV